MEERSVGEIGSKPIGKGEGWVGREEVSAQQAVPCVCHVVL